MASLSQSELKRLVQVSRCAAPCFQRAFMVFHIPAFAGRYLYPTRYERKGDTMNAKLYDRFISDLELKGYAKRSINSYVKSVRQLQRFCNKPLSKITQADLRAYW